MNRKISVGMAVSIVILAMTVTFSITMLVAMRLFDSTVSSVKERKACSTRSLRWTAMSAATITIPSMRPPLRPPDGWLPAGHRR